MKSRGKWAAGLMAILALTICGLLGCSFVGEPNSVEDLLVRYAANPNNTNCVTDVNLNLGLSLSGYRTRIPVTADLQAAGTTAYGNVNVDMSALDSGVKKYKFYVEMSDNAIVVYAKRKNNGLKTWDRTEVDASFKLDIPLMVELLSDAKFMRVSYEADDQVCYELILPAKTIVESFLGMGDVQTSFWEVDKDALLDAVKESKVHVRFNKDCLVRSVSLDLNFTYQDKDVIPVPVKATVDFEAVADGYGTVDPEEVAIPQKVKDRSVLTDDPFYAAETSQELMDASS